MPIETAGEKYLTASEISYLIGVSIYTLNNWYRWAGDAAFSKPPDAPKLPRYWQGRPRGPRLWKEGDLPLLRLFKEWVPKGRGGVMGQSNSRLWGDRGLRAERNRVKYYK